MSTFESFFDHICHTAPKNKKISRSIDQFLILFQSFCRKETGLPKGKPAKSDAFSICW